MCAQYATHSPFSISATSPAVSIVLPTYNRRQHLQRAISSVLRQTFADFELIVVDDGSTDGTAEFVKEFDDSRIVCISLPQNRGQAAARNAGIRVARAPLIAFQDSDDEWLDEKLAGQMEILRREPAAAMTYGDLLRFPRTGAPFTIQAPELAPGRLFDNRPTRYASFGIGIQTCVIRAEVLNRIGGFDERLRCFEDLELFLRITRRHKTVRLPRVLVHYFENEGGVSHIEREELAARHFLLWHYCLDILLHKPCWFFEELHSIRNRGKMGM
jgi:glycosyltransferase involved in cell wall biosynthesis